MAQVWTTKRQNWVSRFQQAVVNLMAEADTLTELCNEFTTNAYGTGGANAIVDAEAQAILPAATALLVAEAEGVLAGANNILPVIATNRAYLENMRP